MGLLCGSGHRYVNILFTLFVYGEIYPFVQLPLQFGRSILDFGRLIFFYTHLDKLYVRETLP